MRDTSFTLLHMPCTIWQLTVIALVCHALTAQHADTDEACSTDLGLLQKSVQMQAMEMANITQATTVASAKIEMAAAETATATQQRKRPEKNVLKENYIKAKRKQRETLRAVAWEGNARLASACHAALQSSLLNVLRRYHEEADFGDVFTNIDRFASNSAGTIHVAMMAYSKKYSEVLRKMALNPSRAGTFFEDDAYSAENVGHFTGPEAEALTMHQRLQRLFSTVGGIDNTTVGSHHLILPPARDKLWIIATSLGTGTKTHPVIVRDNLTYYLTSDKITLPERTIPGAIAFYMDDGLLHGAEAAMDFTPLHDKGIQMIHQGGCWDDDYKINARKIFPHADFKYPGKLDLVALVSASSAARGSVTIGSLNALDTRLAMWAVPDSDDPLKRGVRTIHQHIYQTEEEICSAYALFDGSHTDNLGVAQAVASGAHTVTALVNGYNARNFIHSLGMKGCAFAIFDTDIYHNLFVERKHEDKRRTIWGPTWLWIRINLATAILRTKENKWFGIEPNRHVSLNMILMRSALDADFTDYVRAAGAPMFGMLVQALVETMTSNINQDTMCWMLDEFFDALLPVGKKCTSTATLSATTNCMLNPMGCWWNMYNRLIDPMMNKQIELWEKMVNEKYPVAFC